MKKITIVICTFLLLFSITGCKSNKDSTNIGKKSNIEIRESKEITLDWKNSYGQLEKGTYRIIKSVNVKSTNDKFNTYFVAA